MTYHVKFAKVKPEGVIPTKTKGNAGFDVYACVDTDVVIGAGETVVVPTGIAYEITEGWHLIAKERGSTGKIALKTSAGVNDNNFRGQVHAFLYNGNKYETIIISVDENKTKCFLESFNQDLSKYIIYPVSKAVQQLVPVYSPDGTSEEVPYETLSSTDRGAGMIGSSGK